MKIAIIADTHANLPALKAALNAVKEERCDSIFHVGDAIAFGHDHTPINLQGKVRYINPGSLGCCPMPLARYTIAEYKDGLVNIQHRSVAYDDTDLYRAFESQDVLPEAVMELTTQPSPTRISKKHGA